MPNMPMSALQALNAVFSKEQADTILAIVRQASEGGEEITWDTLEGKPSSFPPAAHTHTVDDVTGLGDALDDLEQRVAALEEPQD